MNIPKVIRAKQIYKQPHIEDVRLHVAKLFDEYGLADKIKPGQRIGITGGSRGIASIVDVLAQVVIEVEKCGGKPFIFPAMGSHGGGTAQGQKEMLEGLGMSEKNLNAPILSSMETVYLGETEFGTPIYADKNAYEADGVIVVNRIKNHTGFTNYVESGLMKMMSIGMGKQKLAELVHSYGVWGLQNIIPANAKVIIDKMNIIAGLAVIENSLDQIAYLEVINSKDIIKREPDLLKISQNYYPNLPFKTCDVLVIKQAGKNISGAGVDSKIIGRMGVWGCIEPEKVYSCGENNDFGGPLIEKIAILDLSEQSHGNALGMGRGDVITNKFFKKIDFKATYNNVLTTKNLQTGMIPIIADDDKKAIEICLNSLTGLMRIEGFKDENNVKMCIIQSTLHEGQFLVSKSLYEELYQREDIVFSGDFFDLHFDTEENLIDNPILHN